jgi:3-oxoacyl-[acyl-carrier protein] reductase
VAEYGLTGKVALVTGANDLSKIGGATAIALADEGVSVCIAHFEPPDREGVADEVRKRGVKVIEVEADLSDPASIASLLDAAEAALGLVDILVNNAAYCVLPDDILTITADSFDAHFAVNARAPLLLMQEFTRRYSDRRSGSIVNVSTDGDYAFPGQLAYGSSKAALIHLTRSMADEIGRYGIWGNAVSLGPIHTGDPSWISPEMEEKILSAIPLGRIGRPEDVADVIVYLASDKARWLTGQVLKVGGGHSV